MAVKVAGQMTAHVERTETAGTATPAQSDGVLDAVQVMRDSAIDTGAHGWPFPVPILRTVGGWRFDAAAAREELPDRRIGANEVDAIGIPGTFERQEHHAVFHPWHAAARRL